MTSVAAGQGRAAAANPAERRGGAPGGGGNPADRRGGGAGGERRNGPAVPANGAMAEALRRAGLLNDKGGSSDKQDRRSNRP